MHTHTLLRLDRVSKMFGEETILQEISLEVQTGEVVVIIGPSGCGKSTLLRCINGLEPIQAGEIALGGEVITAGKTDWSRIRQRVGMVFQSYELFPHKTVLGNMILSPMKVQKHSKTEAVRMADALLERVGLREKRDVYPRQLSGGQKQRVAIVRALMMEPEIMLFDEVTAALDPEMVREVLDVMLELARSGKTMLIVTHEMEFAKAVADRIVFMDGGELIESAPPETFFTQPETERASRFLNLFSFAK